MSVDSAPVFLGFKIGVWRQHVFVLWPTFPLALVPHLGFWSQTSASSTRTRCPVPDPKV